MRISWRTRLIILGVGLGVAGGGVAWWASCPRALVYKGRPINELLANYDWHAQSHFELNSAVRELKAAAPYLVHEIKREPTVAHRLYENFFFRMPQSVRNRLGLRITRYDYKWRGTCVSLLGLTGSNGVAQIPFLARLSREDPSWVVQANALTALERLGPGSDYESVALEALIAATRDPLIPLAESGYGRLGAFTKRAAEVVPLLVKGLENPKVCDECIYSLMHLGGTNEPLIKAAIDRGEADIFREHLESLQKRNATEEGVLR